MELCFVTYSIYLYASILNTDYSPELSSVAMVIPLLKITHQVSEQNQ